MTSSRTDRDTLALHGGTPVRQTLLPYGRQWIDDADVLAVVQTLRSDWLTTGPKVREFEHAFAAFVGASEAVAVANGTAALHAAVYALGIGPGDEVIVPAMTFAASANCVVFQGATPVFADVDAETLLVDPTSVAALITPRTRAIIAVDYAGQPCDYEALRQLAVQHNLHLIADACHAVGATLQGCPVGTLADLSTFSFHPVKHLTTGEGGMITTDQPALAQRMRLFRNHGITSDHHQREQQGLWAYEMVDLGFNYRLSDIQCALGLSQLAKFPRWLEQRQAIAVRYDEAFATIPAVRPLALRAGVTHAYHLYMVRFDLGQLVADRMTIFRALRAEGIGVNVHYIPVHLHPFYQQRFGTHLGLCPVAESAYETLITLPIFSMMNLQDADDVIKAIQKVVNVYHSSSS